MDDLPISARLTIPGSELRVSFARSGGPGGQNVNKVETKVQLRWNPARSTALAPRDRSWLLYRLSSRLTASGDIVIVSSRTRTQSRNREDARARLFRILTEALERPKRRRRSRPSRKALERRLESKRRRGEIKTSRKRVNA